MSDELPPPKKSDVMTVRRTERGFVRHEFKDAYGHDCSLQISSRAICENEDGTVDDPLGWLWLGLDDGNPKIMCRDAEKLGLAAESNVGWQPYPIPEEVCLWTRMHLGETQVRALIETLQHWLDNNGYLPEPEEQDD